MFWKRHVQAALDCIQAPPLVSSNMTLNVSQRSRWRRSLNPWRILCVSSWLHFKQHFISVTRATCAGLTCALRASSEASTNTHLAAHRTTHGSTWSELHVCAAELFSQVCPPVQPQASSCQRNYKTVFCSSAKPALPQRSQCLLNIFPLCMFLWERNELLLIKCNHCLSLWYSVKAELKNTQSHKIRLKIETISGNSE